MQFARSPEIGVPIPGAVSVGDVNVLLVKVSVEDVVTTFTPSIATTPGDTLEIVVSVAWPNSIEPTPSAVDVDAVRPLIGNPVQLVNVPEAGVPNAGVVSVGDVNVLLVSVWIPVKVATVLSIAIVTTVEPL